MTPFILDTDTLSLFQQDHPKVVQHCRVHPPADLAITVITVEEQIDGRYAAIRKARRPDDLALAYQRFAETVGSLAPWTILSFTIAAISRYQQLIALKLNVRRMDLQIAAIVLEDGGTLVTRNTRDFSRVPGLVLEDWSI
jgi:tRNA(fMet)-specific endonuclease VapC